MVKYDAAVLKECVRLFPEYHRLHTEVKNGSPKAIDLVYEKIGFHIDEDDILRAFRNKKEAEILECARRAKSVRDLYGKMYLQVEAYTADGVDE